MRKILFFIIPVIILPLCFQFCGKKIQEKGIIDLKSISIIKKSSDEFFKMGRLEKAVKLETIDSSLIGEIDKLAIDDKTGDIYILDMRVIRKVLRFDRNGKFINSYGGRGRGPGEYSDITGFALDSDGAVILISADKLMKFGKDGKLLKEKRTKFIGLDMTALSGKTYIFISTYRYTPETKKEILIMDSDFNEVGGLSTYDSNMEKYKYVSFSKIAKNGNSIFFIENYDLRLHVYDPLKNQLLQLDVPNNNRQLASVWGEKRLMEDDYTEIRMRLHRFDSVYAFNNSLYLTELCRGKGIYNYWLLNLVKKKALIFPVPKEETEFLKFRTIRIMGSYENGLVGVIGNNEDFNTYKKAYESDYPILKGIEYTATDNPVLVFYRFDKKIWD